MSVSVVLTKTRFLTNRAANNSFLRLVIYFVHENSVILVRSTMPQAPYEFEFSAAIQLGHERGTSAKGYYLERRCFRGRMLHKLKWVLK